MATFSTRQRPVPRRRPVLLQLGTGLMISCIAVFVVVVNSKRPTLPLAFVSSSTMSSRRMIPWHNPLRLAAVAPTAATQASSANDDLIPNGQGLYRPFLDHVWERLRQADTDCQAVDIPVDLQAKAAAAKGQALGSVVRMENRAVSSSSSSSSSGVIGYARAALLETLVAKNDTTTAKTTTTTTTTHTAGIQVLNLVIFPAQPHLPVWGADFVSLPGNKHLILLDAQPMVAKDQENARFQAWYDAHVPQHFPWGGAMPEAVQPYVSAKALWTRLGAAAAAVNENENENGTTTVASDPPMDPIDVIQGPLMQAFQQHLDLYLRMLQEHATVELSSGEPVEHAREAYLQYRLENDPARPMLRALYGEEWSEEVLTTVLFPSLV